MKKNYVYIVKCSDDTLYTGWTNNLEQRLLAHNQGKGAKYTRYRCPITLAYYECFEDKSSALKREYEIKQLTRLEKQKLIASKQNKL